MKKPVFIAAALLLGACGTFQVPAIDAFYVRVIGVVAATSDDAEPHNIDAVVATAPEDSEPVPQ